MVSGSYKVMGSYTAYYSGQNKVLHCLLLWTKQVGVQLNLDTGSYDNGYDSLNMWPDEW